MDVHRSSFYGKHMLQKPTVSPLPQKNNTCFVPFTSGCTVARWFFVFANFCHVIFYQFQLMLQAQQGLAVALDQPLVFDPVVPIARKAPRLFKLPKLSLPKLHVPEVSVPTVASLDWQVIKDSITGCMSSNVFKISLVVMTLFLAMTILSKRAASVAAGPDSSGTVSFPSSVGSSIGEIINRITNILSTIYTTITGRVQRVVDKVKRSRSKSKGIPMPFDYSNDNDGWGVCSLRSKRRLGRSSFVQYEFDLPEPEYILPLDLGQQISLCCLDDNNNVAKGEFFPYSMESTPRPGTFSILAPNRTPSENEFAIGDDAANFVSIMLITSWGDTTSALLAACEVSDMAHCFCW